MAVGAVLTLACGGGDGDEAVAARGVGEIRVATVDGFFNPGQPRSSLDAFFYAKDPLGACKKTTYGGCRVFDCSAATADTPESAGTLSVSTADARVEEAVAPEASGAYAFGEPSLLFAEGDTVSVTASGDAVSAFTVEADFPPTFQALEPQLDSSENTLPIGHVEDTTVRVSGGTAGVGLLAEVRGTRATMRCEAPSEGGEIVLEAEALAEVGGGVVDLRSVTRKAVRAGTYDIDLLLLAGVMQEERLLILTAN